jgi:membrane protease subunit (stomatin/prohibitin family)
MDIWKNVKAEFIDIIEHTFDAGDTLSHRFERHDNEIKMGAKLIVREGQTAVFVNEGQIADVFVPGTYTLSTQNLPVLSTLKGWKYLFDSPFKAEVYFINGVVFANRKWGTSNPVMMRDAELGVVRIRAFGMLSWRVGDPKAFFKSFVGTKDTVHGEDLDPQIKGLVVSALSDALGEAKISAYDLAAKYLEIGESVKKTLAPKLADFGLECQQLVLENISLPPEVEKIIDKRTSMGVVGNTAAYMQFNLADKVGEALTQPGGLAGTFAGAGAGLALGQHIAQGVTGMTGAGNPPIVVGSAGLAGVAAPMPPPLPGLSFHVAVAGQSQGPLDEDALRALVARGQLTPETLVWKAGMAAWAKASTIGELAFLFVPNGAMPPPLPS